MRVGLLVCDHVAEEFKHIDGDYVDMFRRLLPHVKLIPYFVCDNLFPKSVYSQDAWICTGSSHSVYESLDWIGNLTSFVREVFRHHRKFVGICFGHQMIAHALEGRVEKSVEGWCIGLHTFKISTKEVWLHPAKNAFNVLMLCQDQVIELPPDGQILATSDHCTAGMFTVGRNILGIQGHPEFSKTYNKAVYESRMDRIGIEKISAANKSLVIEPDNTAIAGWIMEFLQQS